ncbi:dihydroorotase [Lentiprolixibacter aurantiacus]|uniref:Dihydroorotase n=1 Tax=Lentiprolixibacter aurantiacus TaxID=2993939 RepID=A0AAE3SN85_9FLAO|nr:dihydroorotase [Lentiprolixibacter aurantiacus]MCX2719487.1 dihydroorotase [Lentiprolixibacter aurantiacus]
MTIHIKSALLIDPKNKNLHLKKRDILIRDGIIEKIGTRLEVPSRAKKISFPNLHVSLGWFDSGVSFGEPGFEERETIAHGLEVAGKSGFTEIVLNPNTFPLPDSSGDIVFLKNAGENAVSRLYPLGTLTVKSEGKDLAELYDMKGAGAVGFYDYKAPVTNSNLLKIALQYAQNFGSIVFSFPLDRQIAGKGVVNEGEVSTRLGLKGIPAMAEEIQIARDLGILEYTGGSLHIPTISTAKSVALVEVAKKKGLDVSCSVALHNLWFDDEALEGFDSNYKVLPPLRNSKDIKALIKGLKTGVVDMVTTDHSPLDIEEKRIEFDHAAYGSLGLEHAFGVLNSALGMEEAVRLLTNGRERFGIPSPKLTEGSDANLTLFNPDTEKIVERNDLLSTSKNSMFLGESLKGQVYGVIRQDRILI